MPPYPGVANVVAPVVVSSSGMNIPKGEYQYVFGQLKSGATQLPVNDTNVAVETAASQTSPQASISVNLQAPAAGDPPPIILVEVHYDGAPGAGESIQIQEADTDADAFYITPSNPAYTMTVFTAQNNARADLSPTGGKFMRLLRAKGANNAGIWAKITRLA